MADKFRPIHLRSLSFDQSTNNFNLLLDKGDATSLQKPQIEEITKKLLEYFKIGLTLPNSMFWVNLRPDAPRDIIDPYVEQTDLGRILLEADLQLKKDMARLTAPTTPEGKAYWDKLYQKAESLYGMQDMEIPTITRPWIVPGEIVIGEAKDQAYIYKATLKVMLEQDYLKDTTFYSFDDERAKQLNDYSSQILRELIIPKLTREVNASKRYASLRQVYYSLVLAQWFKQRYQGKENQYASRIDTKDLTGLTSAAKWSKDTYYQAYKKSFSQGEYSLQETIVSPYGETIRSYFSGGLNLYARLGAWDGDIPITAARFPTYPSIGRSEIAIVASADGGLTVNSALPFRDDGMQRKNKTDITPTAQKDGGAGVIEKARNALSVLKQLVSSRPVRKRQEYTLKSYLKEYGAVPASLIVSLQTHLNKTLLPDSPFDAQLLDTMRLVIDYWDHNIANFISRQFSDYRRGIVELVSNGLDATEGQVKVLMTNGQLIVANGGKGVSLENILTSFLIPTYSTKILGEGIGRFGVGFLSAFNYLDHEEDGLEIYSFDGQGKGFKIIFGVRITGEGKARKKTIFIRSIQEGLALEDTRKNEADLFSAIDDVAISGGTAIRIRSSRLTQHEMTEIEYVLRDRFKYWLGTPVLLQLYGEDGSRHDDFVGFSNRDFFELVQDAGDSLHGKGKTFNVQVKKQKYSNKRVDIANKPGQGRLMITLQGVLLTELQALGSNIASEIVINLPASTKIPTSRDKVVPDRNTFAALLHAAETVRDDDSLAVEDRVALINSFYYAWEWLKVKAPSLAAEFEAEHAHCLEDIVKAIIDSQQKLSPNARGRSLAFVPDTLQARDFFKGTRSAILVNPKLLSSIEFVGDRPPELPSDRKIQRLKDVKIFMMRTTAGVPVLKMGNVVFVKDGEGIDTRDEVWQNILAATVIDYWTFMMGQLGQINIAGFEEPGRFGGLDEDAARKALVISFLDKKMKDLIEKLKSLPAGQSEDGLKKDWRLFRDVKEIIEQSSRAGVFYFIFEQEIKTAAASDVALAKDAAVSFADKVDVTHIKEFMSAMKEASVYTNWGPALDLADIMPVSSRIDPAITLAELTKSLSGIRMQLLREQAGLSVSENNFLFAIMVIARWRELDDRVMRLLEQHASSPQGREILAQMIKDIAAYRASPQFKNKNLVSSSEELTPLIDYLNHKYLWDVRASASKAETKKSSELASDKGLMLKTSLSNLVASFFRKGLDITVKDARVRNPEGLRLRASIGQIQQSINYQDTEEFVFIRELLQNVLDAIRESQVAQETTGGKDSARVDMFTRLVQDKGGTMKVEFTIHDRVGMSLDRLLNFLLIPNRSSKVSDASLTGFFGHGFFTVLKEAEQVLIKTSLGNGTAYVLKLVPIIDVNEGVVLDVDVELYKRQEAFRGTAITWRKRGLAGPIDETLVGIKAQMFAGTLEGTTAEIWLNNRKIVSLDRQQAHLSVFRTQSGQVSGVYLNENQPSVVVQRGLFVTRLDRQFIMEVLGIHESSELFGLLARLANLGVVMDLPQDIHLTRDRAHFLKEDLSPEGRKAMLGALFDAAVRAMLCGKITAPNSFGYDFLYDTTTEEVDGARGGFAPSTKESARELIDRLEKTRGTVVRIVKNWVLYSDVTVQDFLREIQSFAKDQQWDMRQIAMQILTSQSYLHLLFAIERGADGAAETEVDAFLSAVTAILESEGIDPADIGDFIEIIKEDLREQAQRHKLTKKDSIDQDIYILLNGIFERSVKKKLEAGLYGNLAAEKFLPTTAKERLMEKLRAPFDLKLQFTPPDYRGAYRSAVLFVGDKATRKPSLRMIFELIARFSGMISARMNSIGSRLAASRPAIKTQAPVEETVVSAPRDKTNPAIERSIADYLYNTIMSNNPFDISEILRVINQQIDEQKRMGASGETPSEVSVESVERQLNESKPLSGHGVSLATVKKFKNDIPALYFFLQASYMILDALRTGNPENRQGQIAETQVFAHDDTNPGFPHLAYASSAFGIGWNLRPADSAIVSLTRYIMNPSDSAFESFLGRMTETLSHEDTHLQERSTDANTHNKAFFDLQLSLLGRALQDPAFVQAIRESFNSIIEEYNQLPEQVKRNMERFVLTDDRPSLIQETNNVLSQKKPVDDEKSGLLRLDGGELKKIVARAVEKFNPAEGSKCVEASRWIAEELKNQGISNQEISASIPVDLSREAKIGDASRDHTFLEVVQDGRIKVIDTQLTQFLHSGSERLTADFVSRYIYEADEYYKTVPLYYDPACKDRIQSAQIEHVMTYGSGEIKMPLPLTRVIAPPSYYDISRNILASVGLPPAIADQIQQNTVIISKQRLIAFYIEKLTELLKDKEEIAPKDRGLLQKCYNQLAQTPFRIGKPNHNTLGGFYFAVRRLGAGDPRLLNTGAALWRESLKGNVGRLTGTDLIIIDGNPAIEKNNVEDLVAIEDGLAAELGHVIFNEYMRLRGGVNAAVAVNETYDLLMRLIIAVQRDKNHDVIVQLNAEGAGIIDQYLKETGRGAAAAQDATFDELSKIEDKFSAQWMRGRKTVILTQESKYKWQHMIAAYIMSKVLERTGNDFESARDLLMRVLIEQGNKIDFTDYAIFLEQLLDNSDKNQKDGGLDDIVDVRPEDGALVIAHRSGIPEKGHEAWLTRVRYVDYPLVKYKNLILITTPDPAVEGDDEMIVGLTKLAVKALIPKKMIRQESDWRDILNDRTDDKSIMESSIVILNNNKVYFMEKGSLNSRVFDREQQEQAEKAARQFISSPALESGARDQDAWRRTNEAGGFFYFVSKDIDGRVRGIQSHLDSFGNAKDGGISDLLKKNEEQLKKLREERNRINGMRMPLKPERASSRIDQLAVLNSRIVDLETERQRMQTQYWQAAVDEYYNALRLALDLQLEPAQDQAIIAYTTFMRKMSDALGEDFTYIYPFMGPDIVPALFRKTYHININTEDFTRGGKIIGKALNSHDAAAAPQSNILGIETARDVKNDANSYLPELASIPGKKILILKDYSRGAMFGYERICDDALAEGDAVVILKSEDEQFADTIIKHGFEERFRTRQGAYNFEKGEPQWAEEDFKVLLFPDTLRIFVKTSASDAGTQKDGGKGGIDLRALPITAKPIDSAVGSNNLIVPAIVDPAVIAHLEKQWREIEQSMQKGPMPYTQMKAYAVDCKAKGATQQMDAMFACIAEILRMEEERAVATPKELKEILTTIG
ncbi:MAG TPA: hypothetical protein PLP56_02250 [Candidatus Omnitrophota bacterium]|nr:hypothetical protein [Candidatus Omnitrophota bacterium]